MIRSLFALGGTIWLAGLLTLAYPDALGAQEFLPVEEAFEASAATDGEMLQVKWRIAEGYYLYRDSIAVESPPGSGVAIDAPKLPAGQVQDDPYFGRTEIYRGQLTAEAALPSGAALSTVLVRYQGCAEDGICYPPQETTLKVATSAIDASSNGTTTGLQRAASVEPEQDRLAALLSGESTGWMIAAFFGAGLLLTFTPCVLPMLPILSGVILGQNARGVRGLALSGSYVLAMAATYAALGTVAGLAGANIQASLQSPWLIVPFAVTFVLLAMAMFGFYELQLPTALQSRLAAMSGKQRGGLVGAAIMGVLSAAIVGPCMTAPLAGALLYIGQTGDAATGGTALFALGLGMGTPLLLIGALGPGVLPRTGAWMNTVKAVFGFVLLGTAVWMLERVLPPAATVALWGLLLAGVAVALGAFDRTTEKLCPARRLARVFGLAAAMWSGALIVGAAAGADDPLRPLAFLAAREPVVQSEPSYESVEGLDQFEHRLAQVIAAGQPVVVDFYADWCVSCHIIEREVFGDPAVQQAMRGIVRLRPDVTRNTEGDIALQRKLQVAGPPSLLFYGSDGQERRDYRVVGEIDAATFLEHLRAALKEEA